jgi:phosphoribosylformylglycinamidine synthase
MAAHSPAMKEVIAAAKRGTRILGVCNGFQILVESGLLPGALLRNRTLKFICKQVYLRAETAQSEFTGKLAKGAIIRVPVAHGEGNYYNDAASIKKMEDADLIAFRYCDEKGAVTESANPNGSAASIAGIFNDGKTILGMMPHPENTVQEWQGNMSGLKLFEGIAASLAA